jgi:CRP-like cAMP-binding protein
LFGQGDSANSFYFMLQGSMQIRVVENDKMKYSKTIDENDIFGLRETLG